MAITDHDTTEGLQEALIIGERIGVQIIPGIKILAYEDSNLECGWVPVEDSDYDVVRMTAEVLGLDLESMPCLTK